MKLNNTQVWEWTLRKAQEHSIWYWHSVTL